MVLPLGVPRQSGKHRSPPRSLIRSTSASSTLTEALRTNPFRLDSSESLVVPEPDDATDELNRALLTLAELFPDVKFEVIRELLLRFDGDSRLEISAEQLYKHKLKWANGRLSAPPRGLDEKIPDEELFRSNNYVTAVKKTLVLEFRSLSKSAIDAVLAEVNNSYTKARPVLRGLLNKSWRFAFTSFFRKTKPQEDSPSCLFEQRKVGPHHPQLHPTGSTELDCELAALFIKAPRDAETKYTIRDDLKYAETINLKEAKEVGALFECQCCYNDVPFENIATCQYGIHVICFDCIRRTLHEAVFGQGWAKSIDLARGTLRCLAPLSDDCESYLPQELVRRAILVDKAGTETWLKYEERLTSDALHRSRLKVVHCPFCSYAEADHVYDSQAARKLRWRFRGINALPAMVMAILFFNFLPLILYIFLPIILLVTRLRADLFYDALGTIALRRRPNRFRCQNRACTRASCLKCQKAWHDPHVCHEPLLLSLRTTVEAARTAAIKRTCPRCGTSFVKASGCNKLICTCGYAMCYLCRKNIGATGDGGGEGYRHFCEHFRPTPGKNCTECQKCDLYRLEDEDAVVRRAGEEAERQWRIKEGMVGVEGLEEAVGNVAGENTMWTRFWAGRWTMQGVVVWVVERGVVLDESS